MLAAVFYFRDNRMALLSASLLVSNAGLSFWLILGPEICFFVRVS